MEYILVCYTYWHPSAEPPPNANFNRTNLEHSVPFRVGGHLVDPLLLNTPVIVYAFKSVENNDNNNFGTDKGIKIFCFQLEK